MWRSACLRDPLYLSNKPLPPNAHTCFMVTLSQSLKPSHNRSVLISTTICSVMHQLHRYATDHQPRMCDTLLMDSLSASVLKKSFWFVSFQNPLGLCTWNLWTALMVVVWWSIDVFYPPNPSKFYLARFVTANSGLLLKYKIVTVTVGWNQHSTPSTMSEKDDDSSKSSGNHHHAMLSGRHSEYP